MTMISRFRRVCMASFAVAATVFASGFNPAAAAPVTLVITYHATPQNWSKLRAVLQTRVASRLSAATRQGRLTHFQLFYNRDIDDVTWAGMAVLDFPSEAALERFDAADREFPAALAAKELALASAVESTECEAVATGGDDRPAAASPFLVIPYRYTVSADAYRDYLQHYTLPQLQGWMKAGILSGFHIYMATFPAGRPWSAMLVLRYRDAAGLAQRDAVKATVRAELKDDPSWEKYSTAKEHIREELPPAVAEEVSSGTK